MSININELTNEIAKHLQQYTSAVEDELEISKEEVADLAVKELRQDPTPELTGDYKKGWRKKKVGNSYIIHNATNYQLTHLLENGHVKRGGGRTNGVPHIRPAEQRVIKRFEERVKKAIKR